MFMDLVACTPTQFLERGAKYIRP
jgi:CRP-like cAMP-binding protein